jgi:hypothetical protein
VAPGRTFERGEDATGLGEQDVFEALGQLHSVFTTTRSFDLDP